MSRMIGFALATAAASVPSAASAGSMSFTGSVPTICVLQDNWTLGAANSAHATVSIFCNASSGARVSALLAGDEGTDYIVSMGGASQRLAPGLDTQIKQFDTAVWGTEELHVTPVDAISPSPVIILTITPEE